MMNNQSTKRARLINTPEDYKKLGVNPETIEKWEDQRRDTKQGGHWEWWYFDALCDDGTAVVIQFFTKISQFANKDYPMLTIKVTLPDGTNLHRRYQYSAAEGKFGAGQCDVQIAKHHFKGDFKNYSIFVDAAEGLGADIKLKSLAQPYRPASSYFQFGKNYFTWLCAVPKGEVSGTITIDGQTREIHGRGYHDHQWGSNMYFSLWNHWLWARQGFDDYSLLVFDLTASKKYGHKRFPIMFIEDKDGNIIFENTEEVKHEVLEEYFDEHCGKYVPKTSHYTFRNGAKQVEYTLTWNKIIENTSAKDTKKLNFAAWFFSKILGLNPSYTRYSAMGHLKITEASKEPIERSGELIYEYMFPGKMYKVNYTETHREDTE